MPQAIPAMAQAVATWASGVAAGAGASTAVFQAVYFTAYASAYAAGTYATTAGLAAYAESRIPDPEGGKSTRRMSRAPRQYAIGGPARIAPAFTLGAPA